MQYGQTNWFRNPKESYSIPSYPGMMFQNPSGCLNMQLIMNPIYSILFSIHQFSSVQMLSHVQHFATPWTAALSPPPAPEVGVHHQLLKFTQTHVHWVSDAIQPSHPLLSPSSPAFNISQQQGLFKCQFFTSSGQSIGVAGSTSVLPMNTQD